jgi:hypothetical protein
MSVADINTAMDTAVAYMGTGDYGAAIAQATKALGLMAILPDSRHGSGEMRWRTAGVEAFINQVRKLQSASNGLGNSAGIMQIQKVNYINPSELSSY